MTRRPAHLRLAAALAGCLGCGCAGIAGMAGLLCVVLALCLVPGGVAPAPDAPPVTPLLPARPATPHLSVELPPHLDYAGVLKQLGKWELEAHGLTRSGTYGDSKQGRMLAFYRVGNREIPDRTPVLVTACIHGNEPLSTGVVMGYIGRLLANYGKDSRITRILDSRDIYFVPVVSPDSYPSSRAVDGVDPNRDFNDLHSPTVAALAAFYKKHDFKAAMSAHTFGRVFLYPRGDSTQPSPDDAAFRVFFGELAKLAGYEAKPAHRLYDRPIFGSDVDFFYKTNRAVACVCEMGTASVGGQRPPRQDEIKGELDRTWPAFLLWLEKAPTLLSGRPSRLPPHFTKES